MPRINYLVERNIAMTYEEDVWQFHSSHATVENAIKFAKDFKTSEPKARLRVASVRYDERDIQVKKVIVII